MTGEEGKGESCQYIFQHKCNPHKSHKPHRTVRILRRYTADSFHRTGVLCKWIHHTAWSRRWHVQRLCPSGIWSLYSISHHPRWLFDKTHWIYCKSKARFVHPCHKSFDGMPGNIHPQKWNLTTQTFSLYPPQVVNNPPYYPYTAY